MEDSSMHTAEACASINRNSFDPLMLTLESGNQANNFSGNNTRSDDGNKYDQFRQSHSSRSSSPQFIVKRRLATGGGQRYFDSGDYAMAQAKLQQQHQQTKYQPDISMTSHAENRDDELRLSLSLPTVLEQLSPKIVIESERNSPASSTSPISANLKSIIMQKQAAADRSPSNGSLSKLAFDS